jgi:DNA-binding HxlR family transcriptional regulator
MPNSNSDSEVSDVISLLDDDCARQILIETMSEPLSANELEERCEVSPPTIYRRLEDLSEHELIAEQTRPAADGHHYSVYRATLDRVEIDLTETGLDVTVTQREGMADRFTSFVEDI